MSTTTLQDLTAPEAARLLRIKLQRLHAFIEAGEIEAYNVATNPNGRPRWRIPPTAIDNFKRRRSAQQQAPAAPRRRKSKSPADITEYVK